MKSDKHYLRLSSISSQTIC